MDNPLADTAIYVYIYINATPINYWDHSKWELASTTEGQQPEGAAAAPAAGEEAEDSLKGWQLVRPFLVCAWGRGSCWCVRFYMNRWGFRPAALVVDVVGSTPNPADLLTHPPMHTNACIHSVGRT